MRYVLCVKSNQYKYGQLKRNTIKLIQNEFQIPKMRYWRETVVTWFKLNYQIPLGFFKSQSNFKLPSTCTYSGRSK